MTIAGPNSMIAARTGSRRRHQGGQVKQLRTDVLDIAYLESGPADGWPVLLLHGWPDDPAGLAGREAASQVADALLRFRKQRT